MKNPRCIQNWRYLTSLLDRAFRDCRTATVSWEPGPERGSLRVVLEFEAHRPDRSSLAEGFESELRNGTPELRDAFARKDPGREGTA